MGRLKWLILSILFLKQLFLRIPISPYAKNLPFSGLIPKQDVALLRS